jgi:hypothetical protein
MQLFNETECPYYDCLMPGHPLPRFFWLGVAAQFVKAWRAIKRGWLLIRMMRWVLGAGNKYKARVSSSVGRAERNISILT